MTMSEAAGSEAGHDAQALGDGHDGARGDEDALELNQEAEAAAEQVGHPHGSAAQSSPDSGRLAFGDDEVRLPWLESDGDEDEYQGYNTGQLASLFILGLLAVAVIGGGIWWAIHHRKDEVLVADGSVITAPKVPYKERPKDPGGKTFAGTGDTSFAVSEGQSRPAKLGDNPGVKPAAEASPKANAAKAGAAPVPPADNVPGIGVQVAAYSNRAQAEAGWTRLSGQYAALAGLHHRVVEGQADIGTVYRLQAVAGDVGAAHTLCGNLKAAGLPCQVKN